MFTVESNIEKNRIYITLGEMGTGDGKKLLDEIKKKIKDLKKGFTGVSDITGFKLTDPEEAVWADKVLQVAVEAGLVRAVRVTNSVTTTTEMKAEHGYLLSLAPSVEEADKILDGFQE